MGLHRDTSLREYVLLAILAGQKALTIEKVRIREFSHRSASQITCPDCWICAGKILVSSNFLTKILHIDTYRKYTYQS